MFKKSPKKRYFSHFRPLDGGFAAFLQKMVMVPTAVVAESSIYVLASVPSDREPAQGSSRVLGVGWYPQIEVDAENRVHLAFVDADPGDVRYAVSQPDSLDFGAAQTVEERGAVGSFLKLALLKNRFPILSYYQQDDMNLRLAHRPGDLVPMQKMGIKVDLKAWQEKAPSMDFPGMEPAKGPHYGMGPQWHGEDVAYGDQVGQASDLFVDHEGRPHLLYFRKGKVAEYAVRPSGEAVFGVAASGRFDRMTLDAKAYASHSMTSDLWVDTDSTVWASYGSWEMTETRLRVATKQAQATAFNNFDVSPGHRSVEGWHSALMPKSGNKLEVFSLATDVDELLLGELDRSAPKPMTDRKVLVNRPGPFAAARGKDGTLWVLTRGEGMSSIGDEAGVWLIKIPKQGETKRWMLESGMATDYWFDLALFADGTPIAVWFSHGIKGLKVYSPKKTVRVKPDMAVPSPVKVPPPPEAAQKSEGKPAQAPEKATKQ